MLLSGIIAAALFLCQPVLAETLLPIDPNNHFIWPPLAGTAASDDPSVLLNNVVIEYGAPQQSKPFSWVSDIPRLSIVLWQEQFLNVPKSHVILDCKTNLPHNGRNTLYWDGELGQIDISLGNVMFLHAYECEKLDSWKFASHYFNLTKAASPLSISSSSSLSSTTTTTTSTTSSDSPTSTQRTAAMTTDDKGAPMTNPTASPSATDGGSSAASSSPTTATLVGGIAGGVVGGLLIAAICFFLWKYCYKGGNVAHGTNQSTELPSQGGLGYDHEEYGYYKPSEETLVHQGDHHGGAAAPAEMYHMPPELAGDYDRGKHPAGMQ